MKTEYDEILNKYIDGELSPEEVSRLKEELGRNNELLNQLKALKITDAALHNLEVTPAPEGFTSKVMSGLKYKSKIRDSVSPFFLGVLGFFSFLILGIIGYLVANVPSENDSASDELLQNVNKNVVPLLDKATEIFTNSNVMFVGGMIAFILFLGLYFMIHTHKSFKQSLEKF